MQAFVHDGAHRRPVGNLDLLFAAAHADGGGAEVRVTVGNEPDVIRLGRPGDERILVLACRCSIAWVTLVWFGRPPSTTNGPPRSATGTPSRQAGRCPRPRPPAHRPRGPGPARRFSTADTEPISMQPLKIARPCTTEYFTGTSVKPGPDRNPDLTSVLATISSLVMTCCWSPRRTLRRPRTVRGDGNKEGCAGCPDTADLSVPTRSVRAAARGSVGEQVTRGTDQVPDLHPAGSGDVGVCAHGHLGADRKVDRDLEADGRSAGGHPDPVHCQVGQFGVRRVGRGDGTHRDVQNPDGQRRRAGRELHGTRNDHVFSLRVRGRSGGPRPVFCSGPFPRLRVPDEPDGSKSGNPHTEEVRDHHQGDVRSPGRNSSGRGLGGRYLQRLASGRAHKLVKRSNGTRSVSVEVPAGQEICFRYLGDGGVWFDDPDADLVTHQGTLVRA